MFFFFRHEPGPCGGEQVVGGLITITFVCFVIDSLFSTHLHPIIGIARLYMLDCRILMNIVDIEIITTHPKYHDRRDLLRVECQQCLASDIQ